MAQTICLPNSAASAGNTGVSSKQVTLPFSVKAGSVILVSGAIWRASDPGPTYGVTDNQGNTYTVKMASALSWGSGQSRGFIAYAVAGSDGALTVTVTPSGSSSFITYSVHEMPDASGTLDVDGGETTGGVSGTSSDGLTTLSADTVIVSLHCADGVMGTITPGAGITTLYADPSTSNAPHALLWRRAATATSYTMSATHNNLTWTCQTLAFKAAASTPPSLPQSGSHQPGSGVASSAVTFGQPVLAGQYIVSAGHTWDGSADPSTIAVSDNLGNSYTVYETGAISWSGGTSRGWVALAKVTTPGTPTVTVNPNGSSAFINHYAMVVQHVDPTTPLDEGPNEDTGTGTSVGGTLVTNEDDTVALALLAVATPGGPTTIAVGNSYVQLFEDESNSRNAVNFAAKHVPSDGSAPAAFTLGTSRTWRLLNLSLNPEGGGGGGGFQAAWAVGANQAAVG